MGAEVLVPLILSGLSAGAKAFNINRTAKKQDRELAEGIRKSSAKKQEATQRIDKNLNFLEESSAQPFKDDLQSQFIARINQARALGTDNLDRPGNVSSAFTKASTGAKGQATEFAGQIASLLAGVDAAGNQRQTEGFRAGDLGMDLKRLDRDADSEDFLARLRASRIRPSFPLSVLSGVLDGGASAAASGGFGG